MMHKAWYNIEEVPYCFGGSSIKFQAHTGRKMEDLNPIWVRLLGWLQLSNPSDLLAPIWKWNMFYCIVNHNDTRPHTLAFNSLRPSDAYMRQWTNQHWFRNGLSPGRRQAIIWTNAGILLIGHLGTCFSEILIEIETFSFKKMHLKMSSAKTQPFCLGLNVLKVSWLLWCLQNSDVAPV